MKYHFTGRYDLDDPICHGQDYSDRDIISRTRQWGRILNIFLPARIKFQSPRVRQSWGKSVQDYRDVRWVQQSYAYEPFNAFLPALSAAAPPMMCLSFPRIHDDINAQFNAGRPIDELWIPVDLAANLQVFTQLPRQDRIRFLRAATAIYAARDAWETSVSSHLTACVQAIEALTVPSSSGRRSGAQPPAAFRAMCERCAQVELATKQTLNALYDVRSDIAHGRRFFNLDELP